MNHNRTRALYMLYNYGYRHTDTLRICKTDCLFNAAVIARKLLTVTLYEDLSKIFRTGAAIYTAVVVAQSTGK
jgi:hypothetical protein